MLLLALTIIVALLTMPVAAHAQGDLVVEPEWLDLGELEAGASTTAPLEIWNDGTAPVTLGQIGFVGSPGPFTLGGDGCVVGLVLDPGWGCDLPVTFAAPQVDGDHEATVFVEGDGGATRVEALVTGSSYLAGKLVAEPSAIDFGVVQHDTTSTRNLSIRNAGGSPVELSLFQPVQIFLGRGFSIPATDCSGTIDPGAGCTISVAFQPTRQLAWVGPMTADVQLRLQSGSVALAVPIRATVPRWPRVFRPDRFLPPRLPPRPRPPGIDYGTIEQDLVRLAEATPRLLRGGPRRRLSLPPLTPSASGRLTLLVRSLGPRRGIGLAKGSLRLTGGRSGRLRFTPTRIGRKLLRRPVKTPVRVNVAFSSDAGDTFRQSLELTVRRPATAHRKKPKPPQRR